jgi:hypothetical protein
LELPAAMEAGALFRFPVTPDVLQKRFGADGTCKLLLAMVDSADEVGRICAREGTAVDYRKGGVATSNLAGRLLAALVAAVPSALEKLPLVRNGKWRR